MTLHLPDSEVTPEIISRNISVSVTDGTNPVSGATVTLSKNNETITSSRTGSAGGCTLTNVEDGNYIINVVKEGYNEYTENITTSVDNDSLTIQLTPTSSP